MSRKDNLIWIDLEMTGLDPDQHSIIEIATVVTDKELTVLAEGPVLAIHQSDEVLAGMDEWNTRQHANSGLTERVRASQVTEAEASASTLEFLRQHVDQGAHDDRMMRRRVVCVCELDEVTTSCCAQRDLNAAEGIRAAGRAAIATPELLVQVPAEAHAD